MTLHYRRGMTLGEFQDMIAVHQREEAARRGMPNVGDVASISCDHPFEEDGMSVAAVRAEGGIEMRAKYRCPACDAKWGVHKLLPFRNKAKAAT